MKQVLEGNIKQEISNYLSQNKQIYWKQVKSQNPDKFYEK